MLHSTECGSIVLCLGICYGPGVPANGATTGSPLAPGEVRHMHHWHFVQPQRVPPDSGDMVKCE